MVSPVRSSALAALAALQLATVPAAAQTLATPPPEAVGRKLVEIYRVAPGKHEAFLRAIALFDEANRRGGVPPRQLYVHSDGASWDFLLIQDAEYPEGKGAAVGRAFREMGLPGGPRFFTEFRTLLLEHTDTFVSGPTTAAAYLAELDARPAAVRLDGGAPSRAYDLGAALPLGGTARWDYLQVDAGARRLYVAHDSVVEVIDLDARAVVGQVGGLAGAHGLAIVPELGRGFVASGDGDRVTAFDLATLEHLAEAPVGSDPDSVTWEPASRRLLVWNGGSRSVSVLDASSLRPLATLPLDGTPEFAVADGRGAVFVNLEERAEILRVDAGTATVGARYPLPGCREPRGLAFDPRGRRLFSACANGLLAVIDADSGRFVGSGRIGGGADAVVFDGARSRVYVSSAEGFVSGFDVEAGGALGAPWQVQTRATGRTMALDPATGALYVPAVDLTLDWSARRAEFAPGGLRLFVFEPVAR